MTATENPPSKYKYVGTRPIRHDGLDKVIGKARFAADLNLTGQLRAVMVRSPHAHARILSIDTSAAEAMPGVKAVVTGADFPALDPTDPAHDEAVNNIARDEVLYNGHTVAAVAATTLAEARAGAAAVKVEYEILPAVLSIDEAIADGAPIANSTNRTLFTGDTEPSNIASIGPFQRGDVEAGFAAADVIVERTFTTKAVHQGYIEPHACVADVGQDGKATIWASSQGHFAVRSKTAAILGWGTDRIKVTPAEIDGGFGGKTTIYLEPIADEHRPTPPMSASLGWNDGYVLGAFVEGWPGTDALSLGTPITSIDGRDVSGVPFADFCTRMTAPRSDFEMIVAAEVPTPIEVTEVADFYEPLAD